MLKIKRVDRKKSKGSNTVVEGMEVDVDNGFKDLLMEGVIP